ncbi:hypothetical protein Acsp03_31440 [Actinomadura sp. NBRC 104412]|uniref:condensation domain-containing protein n=1 Tax=Actinomadura sp. NBRC 104412 TaxID=3032203 RepID=UPI0024A34D25|nr:condensation domain-containing protein [Actinomadura sp. NBRC 104412]GLZ05678.1 hypothetical protein Acsp03_31440 [Actinomadura sp. NBRC 104412]
MDDEGRVVVRFAARVPDPATGPLTWGQRFIWDAAASLAPHDEHMNLTLVVPVPAGPTVGEVAGAVTALVERHASLRTTYPLGDDLEPYQVELSDGELELRISEIRAGPERSVEELAARLAGRSFDLANELPVRAGISVEGGAPRAVVLAFSHIVADAWGGRILRADLERLLSGGDPGAPPEHRPIDQAAFENSDLGRRIEARSLDHWRSRLERFPRTMFATRPRTDPAPRYWRGELSSPALALGVAALMRRYRISANSVVLAALALHLGHLADIDRCAVKVQVRNRWGPERNDSVEIFLQEVPVVFDLDRGSFAVTARAVQDEVIRSARHARCSPVKIRALLDDLDTRRGTRTALDTMINTMGLPVAAPPPIPEPIEDLSAALAALRPGTAFRWTEKREVEGVRCLVISNLPFEDRISVLADTACLPPGDVRALLFGIERLVVHVATAGDEPRAAIAESGLVPFPRGPEWRRLGESWTDLEATAAMVADRAGLAREAVHLAVGDELVAYLAGPVPRREFDRLPERCFAALAQDATVALPDRFVLVERLPPPVLGADGWRRQPALAVAARR